MVTRISPKRLLLVGVSLVPGRVRRDLQAMQLARDELEGLLADVSWGAGFEQVGLAIRYDDHTDLKAKYQRLHRGVVCELPVAVHVDIAKLRTVGWSKHGDEDLRRIFSFVILDVLSQVARKYSLQWSFVREAQKREAVLTDGVSIPAYLGLQPGLHSNDSGTIFERQAFVQDDVVETLVAAGVTIAYPTGTGGVTEDLDRRDRVEKIVEDYLQSTNNGAVTGVDFGSGSISVFCDVRDAVKAALGIRDVLAKAGLVGDATITRTIRDEDVVVHPVRDGQYVPGDCP